MLRDRILKEEFMPIHSSAVVDPGAQIDPTATIAAYVVIQEGVVIGPGSRVGASSIIMANTAIGENCHVSSHVTLGEVPQDIKYRGQPTNCRIGDDCVLREGVTVHRATTPGGTTLIGNRCLLMTNSHVAHDCVLEEDVVLESGALLGGHVQVGRGARIAQNSGIHQFVRIGELAAVAAVTMIAQDVPPFLTTDHDGRIVGINRAGLNEAGVSSEIQREIETLFKVIYGSEMSFHKAIELADELTNSEFGTRFVGFFNTETRRGFRKRNEASDDVS